MDNNLKKSIASCAEFLCSQCPYNRYESIDYKLKCIHKLMVDIDADINKVGKWIKKTWIIFDTEKTGYRCSECNTTWDSPTQHCPNCGIKMIMEN